MRRRLIVFGLLSGCWYDQARPARPVQPTAPEPTVEAPTASYRSTTIAADAIGVAAMTAGLVGLQRGSNENVSGGLLVAGLATAAFATPIIHLAHGKRLRAVESYLLRSMLSTTGMMIGLGAACSDPRKELFCGLDGMMWGVAGGLAVSGAIDAIFLHDRRTWMPTVTAGDGGARVGILGAF